MVKSVLGRIRDCFADVSCDDRGIGVVEVILILVVLIGLVVIFRDNLNSLVSTIFGNITEEVQGI
ncbi:MAG: hypothetical protein J5367_05750 [Lachnospiraceae bacterium]|nr:hypothetical protein [Lachnospiraceae bacterium]